MKNDIIDTTYPAAELPLRIFIVLIIISGFILGNVLRPDEPNIMLFSGICWMFIFSILYFTVRQRSVVFDGKNFNLENALGRSELIDACLFKEINSIILSYYKIKFKNGKSYLFVLNNSSFLSNAILTTDTIGYDKRLTKQIKEIIENENKM